MPHFTLIQFKSFRRRVKACEQQISSANRKPDAGVYAKMIVVIAKRKRIRNLETIQNIVSVTTESGRSI